MGSNFFYIISLFLLTFGSCNKNEQMITIKILGVDSITKEERKNDRIDIREIKNPLFSMRQFVKIGEYYTDDKGYVEVKLSRNKRYSFLVFGIDGGFGSTEFDKNELLDNQQITIEIVKPENRTTPKNAVEW